MKNAIEAKTGRKLSREMEEWLYENTGTIAIDEALHKMRRTTGARNTASQIAADAADLRMAFETDALEFKRLALREGLDLDEIERAINALRDLTEDLGVYAWVE